MGNKIKLEDIYIDRSNYVHINGIGRVALWWKSFDKKVSVDYSIGKSFIANTEEEVKAGLLKQLNNDT